MLWGRAIVSAIIKYKSVENVSIAVTIVEATDCSFLLPKYQLLYWLFYPYIFSSQNSWNSQRSATATLFWKLSLLSKLIIINLYTKNPLCSTKMMLLLQDIVHTMNCMVGWADRRTEGWRDFGRIKNGRSASCSKLFRVPNSKIVHSFIQINFIQY